MKARPTHGSQGSALLWGSRSIIPLGPPHLYLPPLLARPSYSRKWPQLLLPSFLHPLFPIKGLQEILLFSSLFSLPPSLLSFLFKRFSYLFYPYEYTVADFRYTRRRCRISLRVGVSHHVVVGFELRTFGSAVSALTGRTTSPALKLFLKLHLSWVFWCCCCDFMAFWWWWGSIACMWRLEDSVQESVLFFHYTV